MATKRYFAERTQSKIVRRFPKSCEIGCGTWDEAKEVLLERLERELKAAEIDLLLARLRVERAEQMRDRSKGER